MRRALWLATVFGLGAWFIFGAPCPVAAALGDPTDYFEQFDAESHVDCSLAAWSGSVHCGGSGGGGGSVPVATAVPCSAVMVDVRLTRDPRRAGLSEPTSYGTNGCPGEVRWVLADPPGDGWVESLAASVYAAIWWPDVSLGLSQFNGSQIYAGFEYSLVVESGFEELRARDCAVFLDYPHCVEIVAMPQRVVWDVGVMNEEQGLGPRSIVCDSAGDPLAGDPDFKGGTGWGDYGGPACMNIWWGMSRDFGDVSLGAEIGWVLSLDREWPEGSFDPSWGDHVETSVAGPFRAVSFTSLNSSGTGSGD